MWRRKTVLTVHEHDGLRAARRFVALLCLAEFYVLFVCSGEQYWKEDDTYWGDALTSALASEQALLPLFIGSFVFFLCGRGLWMGRANWRRWLWFGFLGLSAILTLEISTVIDWTTIEAAVGFGEDYNRPTLGTLQQAYRVVALHLPILLGLIVLLLAGRIRPHAIAARRAPWVTCAILYCLCWIPTVMYKGAFARAFFDWAVGALTNDPFAKFYTVTVHVCLLLMLIGSLISRSWIARTVALVIVTVNSVILWQEWHLLRDLISIAITSLFHSLPFSESVDRGILVMNHDFFWLAVYPFRYVLPWLLIAIYAWRVPMWMPADDGTPFPRRYCAKCLYNLHGNKKDRCTECGSDLGQALSALTTN